MATRQIVSAFIMERHDFGEEQRSDFVRVVTHGFLVGARVCERAIGRSMVYWSFRVGPEPRGELMVDKYVSYHALHRAEREDIDYRIRIVRRKSSVAIIAPHGGWIEPETSLVAEAIAGDDHSLYCFEGLRDRPHGDLHVTSTNFDEPQCVELVRACDQVIAVHGKAGKDKQYVEVGGLDVELRDAVCNRLATAGFAATVVTSGTLAARSPRNICNRGARGVGVQLEITRGLRNAQRKDTAALMHFANAVRAALGKNGA